MPRGNYGGSNNRGNRGNSNSNGRAGSGRRGGTSGGPGRSGVGSASRGNPNTGSNDGGRSAVRNFNQRQSQRYRGNQQSAASRAAVARYQARIAQNPDLKAKVDEANYRAANTRTSNRFRRQTVLKDRGLPAPMQVKNNMKDIALGYGSAVVGGIAGKAISKGLGTLAGKLQGWSMKARYSGMAGRKGQHTAQTMKQADDAKRQADKGFRQADQRAYAARTTEKAATGAKIGGAPAGAGSQVGGKGGQQVGKQAGKIGVAVGVTGAGVSGGAGNKARAAGQGNITGARGQTNQGVGGGRGRNAGGRTGGMQNTGPQGGQTRGSDEGYQRGGTVTNLGGVKTTPPASGGGVGGYNDKGNVPTPPQTKSTETGETGPGPGNIVRGPDGSTYRVGAGKKLIPVKVGRGKLGNIPTIGRNSGFLFPDDPAVSAIKRRRRFGIVGNQA